MCVWAELWSNVISQLYFIADFAVNSFCTQPVPRLDSTKNFLILYTPFILPDANLRQTPGSLTTKIHVLTSRKVESMMLGANVLIPFSNEFIPSKLWYNYGLWANTFYLCNILFCQRAWLIYHYILSSIYRCSLHFLFVCFTEDQQI